MNRFESDVVETRQSEEGIRMAEYCSLALSGSFSRVTAAILNGELGIQNR